MKKINSKEVILTIVVGFLILFYFLKYNFLINCALIISILGLISNKLADLISSTWMKFAEIMGKIMNPVILSIVFFLFLTPLAFLMRIFKKIDALKLNKISSTLYDERNHTYQAKDLENTW